MLVLGLGRLLRPRGTLGLFFRIWPVFTGQIHIHFLIDAARAQGTTWETLAGVLRVGDRRAAQRRAARLAHAARLARLPPDNRPPPDVARYDELLPSRRRPHPATTGSGRTDGAAGSAARTRKGVR
jgi:hypothetical protein